MEILEFPRSAALSAVTGEYRRRPTSRFLRRVDENGATSVEDLS
jgi:hypothetical protein